MAFAATGSYGANNTFSLQLSDPTGGFVNNVTTLATVSRTAFSTLTASIPNSVALGSGYRLRMVSSNPALTNMPSVEFAVTASCECTTMSSIRSGNWNDPATWSCNRRPNSTDQVWIKHLVTLPNASTAQARRLKYDTGGRLLFGTGAKLRLGIN